MENLFKPEQYKKKIESSGKEFLDDEFVESFIKLQTPIGNFSAKEKSGDTRIESEELDLDISFDTPKEYQKLTIKYFLDSLVSKMGLEKSDFEKISDLENWRTLEKFDFKFKDSERINLLLAMPENCKIIFYDHPEFVQAVYVHGTNEVLYIGKLNSAIAIPTILHEIGHGWDMRRLDELGVDSLVEHGRESVHLETIRKERAASAFALKKLRTSIKNEDTKKDIDNFLKNLALGGYCESARNNISRQESMDHGMDSTDYEINEVENEERKSFNQFLDWKETEEYIKWKELDEFKNIEEWDEYRKWKEWNQKQGDDLKNRYSQEIIDYVWKRLAREGVTNADSIIGTRDSIKNKDFEKFWNSVKEEDIKSLITSYENNKVQQLKNFETYKGKYQEGDFVPGLGEMISNDTSWWDNRISDLNKLLK